MFRGRACEIFRELDEELKQSEIEGDNVSCNLLLAPTCVLRPPVPRLRFSEPVAVRRFYNSNIVTEALKYRD